MNTSSCSSLCMLFVQSFIRSFVPFHSFRFFPFLSVVEKQIWCGPMRNWCALCDCFARAPVCVPVRMDGVWTWATCVRVEIYFVWLFLICSVGSSMWIEWDCEIVFACGRSFCIFFSNAVLGWQRCAKLQCWQRCTEPSISLLSKFEVAFTLHTYDTRLVYRQMHIQICRYLTVSDRCVLQNVYECASN